MYYCHIMDGCSMAIRMGREVILECGRISLTLGIDGTTEEIV